jgi:8-oxo-dGTP diphosphatase
MNSVDPVVGVGVVVFRDEDVLIVKRKNPPNAGTWSIPGGRKEPGEDFETAVHRELMEETGIKARIIGKIVELDVEFDKIHYRLHDYAAIWAEGVPVAGDDASEAQFMSRPELERLEMWDKTKEVIAQAREIVRRAKNG